MLSLAEWRDEYLVARTGSRSWIQGSVWSRCWRKRSESRTYVIAFVNDLKVLKKFQPFSLKGLFGLAANLLQPATVAIRWSKNRKISNYLQWPSPLRQLLEPATCVNEALTNGLLTKDQRNVFCYWICLYLPSYGLTIDFWLRTSMI